jgi:TetR/AcrR family transcriptional regulator, regulator of autoinduction and epiphytic fitness
LTRASPLRPAVDPRIERSRQAILGAALEELGETGYGGFTIESVAARAGVGKSTIYRHWPDKLALIADAFRTFHEAAGPDIARGSPREKLLAILRHVAEIVVSSTFSACIPALVDAAERDQELRKFHLHFQREARRPLITVITDGVADGSFPSHVVPELAAFALLGAIFFCRLMTNKPLDPERVGELIETVIGTSPQRA